MLRVMKTGRLITIQTRQHHVRDVESGLNRTSSIESVKKLKHALTNAFERSARYILRSGSYASHISYEQAPGTGLIKSSKYSGWRGGVLAASCSAALVLMINTVFTIYGLIVSKSGTKVGTLMSGDCGRVGAINTGLHIAINIAGTLLVAFSWFLNFCSSSASCGP
ncbi:hypothetical protein HYFRA_00013696 [Hymenoscyphus fraxineus]|uniref:DUF6536 domain-containing protein n=1 Tax=Hymenoscyphus fraxineus TaxID=746836 RepID=A0A9N9PVY7_9HELO|nr:hypothetical protein HYFRA_00013696 [Hymenoscyphus fraxineus]